MEKRKGRTKGRRMAVRVTLTIPEDADRDDVVTYIQNAVCVHRGSLKPPGRDPEDPDGDPMFNLDPATVVVRWPVKR